MNYTEKSLSLKEIHRRRDFSLIYLKRVVKRGVKGEKKLFATFVQNFNKKNLEILRYDNKILLYIIVVVVVTEEGMRTI